MLELLASFAKRAKIGWQAATRNLDAASGGRRWRDVPAVRAEASWIHGGAGLVGARAANYVLNNAHGAKIAQALPDNLVGTGIRPRPSHPSETMRTALVSDFAAWSERADADGRGDLYTLQYNAARDMVVLGEALLVWMKDVSAAPQLRRLHPEQLDRSKTVRLDTGRTVHQGVEFDAGGRIVAYWLRPSAPGDALVGLPLSSERWPASEVIHVFRQLFPGQVRGLSWLAPVLVPSNGLGELIESLMMRARVAALHAGFISTPDGEVPYEGEQAETDLDVVMEPGAIVSLPQGSEIKFSEPPDNGNMPAFMTEMLRMIATGVGLTYEQTTGDFSQVNYSSARAAMLEFRRFAETVQHNVLVFQLCRPVWRRFVLWQVLRGRITAAAFQAQPEQFLGVKWLPPAWAWVDPKKDAEAAILEMDNNLRSRAEIVAERGYDVEELDREIAADREREKRLGIAPLPKPAIKAPVEEREAE